MDARRTIDSPKGRFTANNYWRQDGEMALKLLYVVGPYSMGHGESETNGRAVFVSSASNGPFFLYPKLVNH